LFADGRGRRSNKENEAIMKDFRNGGYDVLVNVKMLTEGVDVPDVKTVMITRQTTSPILFTQMVGRALRGSKARGGKDKTHANIVLFMDNWKRLLPFVTFEGEKNPLTPLKQGKNPFETISIQLIKIACEEGLEDDDLLPTTSSFVAQFFNDKEDNLDGNLYSNISNIIRHIAQNRTKPKFLNFNERNVYDLDRIASQLIDLSPRECLTYLKNLFNDEGTLWKVLYGNFMNFKKAFDHAVNRILFGPEEADSSIKEGLFEPLKLLTEEIRQQVYKRDNYHCLCCGKERRKGVSLEIDHILPIAMGGKNVPSNFQTLCRQCNGIKGVNEIDYRSIMSPLNSTKEMMLFDSTASDNIENVISRIVNHIYHCKALCSLEYSQRSNGKNYTTWIINLYNGNNPHWLENKLFNLLEYVQNELGWNNVEKIIIKS
jgi:5-methylcytosine-specific restriction endonuclease McrA